MTGEEAYWAGLGPEELEDEPPAHCVHCGAYDGEEHGIDCPTTKRIREQMQMADTEGPGDDVEF